MKERPILFSAPMVRAILDRRKTQTRRVMKPQMEVVDVEGLFSSWAYPIKGNRQLLYPNAKQSIIDLCPYGKPGDRLWVRETWQCLLEAHNCKIGYAATPDNWKNIDLEMLTQEQDEQAWHWAKKVGYSPSIHMPRWASRILLEIVSVRAERLNDIGEADAKAEGVERDHRACFATDTGGPAHATATDAFQSLWESINGTDSWKVNPWVWVIEFKRVDNQQTEGE